MAIRWPGRIPWLTLAGQVVAIVGSILLAFAIDAWWADRQEQREVHELLRVFADELDQNIAEVESELAFRDAKSQAAQGLLALAAGSKAPVAIDEFDTLLNDLTWWGISTFSVGALDAIVEGDNLSLIEPVELRSRLSSWEEEMNRVQRIEQQDYETYQLKLLPFLVARTNLPQVSNASDGRPGVPEEGPYNKVPRFPQRDHRPLLEDPEFVALLTVTFWDQEDVRPALQGWLTQARNLRNRLAGQLR